MVWSCRRKTEKRGLQNLPGLTTPRVHVYPLNGTPNIKNAVVVAIEKLINMRTNYTSKAPIQIYTPEPGTNTK
jgi:hypothetical protein